MKFSAIFFLASAFSLSSCVVVEAAIPYDVDCLRADAFEDDCAAADAAISAEIEDCVSSYDSRLTGKPQHAKGNSRRRRRELLEEGTKQQQIRRKLPPGASNTNCWDATTW